MRGFQGDLLPLGEAPRSSSPLLPLLLGLGLRSPLGLGLRSPLGLGIRSPLGLGLRPLAAGLWFPSDGLRLRLLLLLFFSIIPGLSARSEPLLSPLSFGGGLTSSRGLGLLGLLLPSGVRLRSFAGGEADRMGLLL
jgi:hypothetical protein